MILKLSKLQLKAKTAREKALCTILDFLENQQWYLTPAAEFTSPQDSSLYRVICFQIIRNFNRYQKYTATLANRGLKKVDVEAQSCILLGLAQLELGERVAEHAAIGETVELMAFMKCPHLKSMTNACLRRFQREQEEFRQSSAEDSLSLKYSHPQWMIKRWANQFGDETTLQILEANQTPAPTSLVSSPKTTPKQLTLALEKQGFELADSAYPAGKKLQIVKTQGLFETEEFSKGLFFVQDQSSQKVTNLCVGIKKDKTLDACASPGGKLFNMEWSYAGEIKELVGIELDEKRFVRMQANHKRLKSKAKLLQGAFRQLDKDAFDLILVDAPCSATGNIRKYPEIKYLRDRKGFLSNQVTQLEILNELKAHVKPEGHILYATCSLEQDENQDVVRLFLEANPNFEHVKFAEGEEILAEGFFQATPNANQLAAFAALLRRVS
ncbi:MAG: transcription antitermination factor NusB [SAR324 cluster bacterium]|nr:transcription antitermination factor NusB [SAR324 cluster bacterium]